jgi:hypothetical protein
MATLNTQLVKEKTVDLAFVARQVIQQLVSKDRSAEAFAAQEILEKALLNAIPDSIPPVPALAVQKETVAA